MQRLILAFAILIGISSHGQQIPNGDFETWVQESYGEEPANWGEYSLQLLNSIIPGLVDSTIVKSLDAYSGTYAMELRSKVLSSIITDTIIPLVMLNLKNENLDASKMKIDSNLESLSCLFLSFIEVSPFLTPTERSKLFSIKNSSIEILICCDNDLSGVIHKQIK